MIIMLFYPKSDCLFNSFYSNSESKKGTMKRMLKIENRKIVSEKSMLVVLCIAIGTIIGELLYIEKRFEQFG